MRQIRYYLSAVLVHTAMKLVLKDCSIPTIKAFKALAESFLDEP